MWNCANCQTSVEDSFDVCWNCGTSADGSVDPAFAPEEDVAERPADWAPLICCEACGYEGKVMSGHFGYEWWMLPVAIGLSLSVVGVVAWIPIWLYLGNRTFNSCPHCGERERLRDWRGVPTLQAEETWRLAKAADERKFASSNLLLLASLLGALALATVYSYFALNLR